MKVLVTGATGYVGGRLVPRLLDEGHEVRTTTSSPDREGPWWSDRVETVVMDVTDAAQVETAVAGTDAVYYLVHAMGGGRGGDDFLTRDREAGTNLAQALDRHGVPRVVYLSGIVPQVDPAELSDHITSRHEVEQILTASTATAITLRAAVVLGSGSTSFEIIRQVSERLPVQTVPDWMDSRVQPIAVTDVVEALLGALTADTGSRSYDVGGPEVVRYGELLDRYASLAGLIRPQVEVPFLPTDLVGGLVGALTDVPTSTVQALVESLHHDMVCAEDDMVRDLLPTGYTLTGIDEAIVRSLADPDEQGWTHPAEADPLGPLPQDPAWAQGGRGVSWAERTGGAVEDLSQLVGDTARRVLGGSAGPSTSTDQ